MENLSDSVNIINFTKAEFMPEMFYCVAFNCAGVPNRRYTYHCTHFKMNCMTFISHFYLPYLFEWQELAVYRSSGQTFRPLYTVRF